MGNEDKPKRAPGERKPRGVRKPRRKRVPRASERELRQGEHGYRVPFVAPEHPWDRQPGENDRAWAAFVKYRDDGIERSQARVAKHFGKSIENYGMLSTRWDWVARVSAYEAWRDRQLRMAEIEEAKAMRRRHIEFAMSFQGAAALALNKIIAAEQKPLRDANGQVVYGEDGKPLPGPLTLKPSEVKELADLGLRIERLNRGEPGEIEDVRISAAPAPSADYSALTLEELRVLRELTRKARGGLG